MYNTTINHHKPNSECSKSAILKLLLAWNISICFDIICAHIKSHWEFYSNCRENNMWSVKFTFRKKSFSSSSSFMLKKVFNLFFSTNKRVLICYPGENFPLENILYIKKGKNINNIWAFFCFSMHISFNLLQDAKNLFALFSIIFKQ